MFVAYSVYNNSKQNAIYTQQSKKALFGVYKYFSNLYFNLTCGTFIDQKLNTVNAIQFIWNMKITNIKYMLCI